MKKILFILLFAVSFSYSQRWNTPAENKIDNPVIKSIIDEATNNSQLENLAHELFDVVGPRLVGTPQMQQAHDWAVAKYNSWGIDAYNHEYGKWRGWERGITHIDMVEPRVRTLVGRQLAWSPSTKKKGVTAEVTLVPDIESKEDFENWLKTIKGKFVLVSQYQPTGRPDSNWEEFALPESFEKMKNDREEMSRKWFSNLRLTG
jgi:carboxypeptidase Q